MRGLARRREYSRRGNPRNRDRSRQGPNVIVPVPQGSLAVLTQNEGGSNSHGASSAKERLSRRKSSVTSDGSPIINFVRSLKGGDGTY